MVFTIIFLFLRNVCAYHRNRSLKLKDSSVRMNYSASCQTCRFDNLVFRTHHSNRSLKLKDSSVRMNYSANYQTRRSDNLVFRTHHSSNFNFKRNKKIGVHIY